MKFKTIALIFNIVLFVTFLSIFFIPLLILDGFFLKEFWINNFWVLLLIILFSFIVNFFLHRKKTLMNLLEAEDWPALQAYLEVQIYEKRKITRQNVKVFVESSILISDFESVNELKDFLQKENQKEYVNSALLLGLGNLLQRKYAESADFYDSICKFKISNTKKKSGVLFFAAYSWLKQEDSVENQQEVSVRLLKLLNEKTISVYSGIATYILKNTSWKFSEEENNKIQAKNTEVINRIKKSMNLTKWEQLANSETKEIYGLLLKKLLVDSEKMIFVTTD